jgi:hypothetical protein
MMSRRDLFRVAGCLIVLGIVGCGKTPVAPDVPSISRVSTVTTPPSKPTEEITLSAPLIKLSAEDFGVQILADQILGSNHAKRDVTTSARWIVEPEGIVSVDSGYVRPLRPGTAKVRAEFGSGIAESSVEVAESTGRDWEMAVDVVPLLTRAGCNAGGCHGRADGQNGFHLSFFGYDPEADHFAITRQDGGRRISPLQPESSLFLLKASGRVPHVGGPRVLPGSPEYQRLLRWISAGSPLSRGKSHGAITGIRVEPAEIRLGEPGVQQLRVVARSADGFERDVTRQAIYKVNDDSSASIDGRGKATLIGRAETDVVVRYGSHVVSRRLSTVINPGLAYDFAGRTRANFIDDELFKRLESLRVPPSPPASDATFLRRLTLDMTGQQPRPEQVREFLADSAPDKRSKLVDRLLKERDFVRFWQIKLGDLLEITSARPEFSGTAVLYQSWVGARLTDNTPWDMFVRTLVTAVGDPALKEDSAANYALDGFDPKIQAEKTAQRFLGLRMRCAQCHDHPFDVWTQDDYFGLAAIFAKVDRGGGDGSGAMMGRTKVVINPTRTLEHLRTHKPAEPRLLSHQPIKAGPNDDPRKAFADWMTSPENPYFARAMCNWVWAQFFGRGIVDPPDDLSQSNPPVHPELLDALAKHFIAHKYDVRDLIRTIATSEAYRLSSATVTGNESDHRLFSHQIPRPLTAHQMADALAQVTDVVNRYGVRPAGTRAIDVFDPSTPSTILETFGRCTRQNGCASVQTPSLSLRQSLLLIGGDVIEGKVSHLNGYLANMLELKPSAEEVIENLYFRTLCRPPTSEELSHWSAELKGAATLREAAEDLFWALLNSREFAFNH